MDSKKKGNLGESIACKYLLQNKFKILLRNHREKFDEIDIIAGSFDGILVFVEVKALSIETAHFQCLSPEDHLTRKKYLKMRRACLMFIAKHPKMVNFEKGWRIDLVAILLDGEKALKINYYENI